MNVFSQSAVGAAHYRGDGFSPAHHDALHNCLSAVSEFLSHIVISQNKKERTQARSF